MFPSHLPLVLNCSLIRCNKGIKILLFFFAIRFLLILVAESFEIKGEAEKFKNTFTGKSEDGPKWGRKMEIEWKRELGMRQ